jgi:hypothetical protein
LSFFLPSRLVKLEYLVGASDEDYDEVARPFSKEIDLAFFVVNFGYSKSDYEALTKRERAFIYKAWESKRMLDAVLVYKGVFAANYNLNRKKGKQPIEVWVKPKTAEITAQKAQKYKDGIRRLQEREKANGQTWMQKVFKANGRIRSV